MVTKYGRAVFIDIDAYQQFQGPYKVCAINVWGSIIPHKLVLQFSGGSEVFINQQDESIKELKYLVHKPNYFMYKTLFKKFICNINNNLSLSGIYIMDPSADIEQFEA